MKHLQLTKVSDDKNEVPGFYFASNPNSRNTFFMNFHRCGDKVQRCSWHHYLHDEKQDTAYGYNDLWLNKLGHSNTYYKYYAATKRMIRRLSNDQEMLVKWTVSRKAGFKTVCTPGSHSLATMYTHLQRKQNSREMYWADNSGGEGLHAWFLFTCLYIFYVSMFLHMNTNYLYIWGKH